MLFGFLETKGKKMKENDILITVVQLFGSDMLPPFLFLFLFFEKKNDVSVVALCVKNNACDFN